MIVPRAAATLERIVRYKIERFPRAADSRLIKQRDQINRGRKKEWR